MSKRPYYISAVIMFILLAFSSCKSIRSTYKPDAVTMMEKREFFDHHLEVLPNFNYFDARLNVNINTGDKQLSSRVNLKMVKDQAFQLSVQPLLGIEMFRIIFTTERLLIIDRMNKRYLEEDYTALKGKLPIGLNYYSLQALFINQMFLPNKKAPSMKDMNLYDFEVTNTAYEFTTHDAMKLQYHFIFDGDKRLVSTQMADRISQYQLYWDYMQFESLGRGKIFPKEMNVNLQYNGFTKGYLNILYSRIDTSGPIEINYSIPSKYKRVSYEEIMKSLVGK